MSGIVEEEQKVQVTREDFSFFFPTQDAKTAPVFDPSYLYLISVEFSCVFYMSLMKQPSLAKSHSLQ